MDVLTVGEALTALVTPQPGRLETCRTLVKSFGGSEANTAIGLARLGRSVRWVSVVGDDPFGREIVTTLRGEGVDVDRVRTDPDRPTALMIKELRTAENAHVHYYRHGSAATTLDEDDVSPDQLADVRHVHLTGITLALGAGPRRAAHRLLEEAKGRGIPVSFDPNLRRKMQDLETALEGWQQVFPFVTDLLLSESEAQLCAPGLGPRDALVRLAENGFGSVVITRGPRGVLGIQNGEVHEVPAHTPPVVVDTVGGGDAFTVGFLHERLEGAPFERCLSTGTWAAGHVVAQLGDWEGLPDRHDYLEWTQTRATIRR